MDDADPVPVIVAEGSLLLSFTEVSLGSSLITTGPVCAIFFKWYSLADDIPVRPALLSREENARAPKDRMGMRGGKRFKNKLSIRTNSA